MTQTFLLQQDDIPLYHLLSQMFVYTIQNCEQCMQKFILNNSYYSLEEYFKT